MDPLDPGALPATSLDEVDYDGIDAFLDDYLQELGPGMQRDESFGSLGLFNQPSLGLGPQLMPGLSMPFSSLPEAGASGTAAAGAEPSSSAQDADAQDAGPSPGRGGKPQRAGAGRKKKDSTAPPKISRRAQALQEKNRRAQQRFRERQKNRVADLEAQVNGLELRNATLDADKSGLESRIAVLEKVVAMRDGTIEQLRASAASRSNAADAAERAASSARQAEDDLPVIFNDVLTLTVHGGRSETVTPEQIKGMTHAELQSYYKAYVHELATALVDAGGASDAPAIERIKRLIDEMSLLITRVALCSPPSIKAFITTRVDDPRGRPPDDQFMEVARALNVSTQQRRELGQLRRLFLLKLAKIAADRSDINAVLRDSLPGGVSNAHMGSKYLQTNECIQRLRANMREEHILVLDFVSTIMKHVFQPSQVAKFMIHSYPWTPDCLALCTWVAAEDGDTEAVAALAAHAGVPGVQAPPLNALASAADAATRAQAAAAHPANGQTQASPTVHGAQPGLHGARPGTRGAVSPRGVAPAPASDSQGAAYSLRSSDRLAAKGTCTANVSRSPVGTAAPSLGAVEFPSASAPFPVSHSASLVSMVKEEPSDPDLLYSGLAPMNMSCDALSRLEETGLAGASPRVRDGPPAL